MNYVAALKVWNEPTDHEPCHTLLNGLKVWNEPNLNGQLDPLAPNPPWWPVGQPGGGFWFGMVTVFSFRMISFVCSSGAPHGIQACC
jgi:hypothetical protein